MWEGKIMHVGTLARIPCWLPVVFLEIVAGEMTREYKILCSSSMERKL